MKYRISNISIPKECILHDFKKCHGIQRWKDDKGYFYEWDRLHGHIEKYSKNGIHLGSLDQNGHFIDGPVVGRRIDL